MAAYDYYHRGFRGVTTSFKPGDRCKITGDHNSNSRLGEEITLSERDPVCPDEWMAKESGWIHFKERDLELIKWEKQWWQK